MPVPLRRIPRAIALALATLGASAADPALVTKVADDGGWPAYVLRNGLVTVTVVPQIGGRVMRYDLGAHAFLWTNPLEAGKLHEPAEDAPWHDLGGYKTWIAPQLLWRRGLGGWPPPPQLDGGVYTASIDDGEPGQAVLSTLSPIEDAPSYQAVGLQSARRFTLYPGSTRLRVDQALTNTGSSHALTSIWDHTQVIGAHAGEDDYDKFWIYFPLNRESAFGPNGYMAFPGYGAGYGDGQWKTYAADGIGAVQYLRHGGRLGADADGGWICYVDEREGYAYAKRFAHAGGRDAKAYPDGGISIAVSTSGDEPYMGMEVMSPLVDLAPGQSITFTEDWYSARIGGPVLAVTEAGIVKRRLAIATGDKTMRLAGGYGVFYEGTVAVTALDAAGKRTALGSYYATPAQAFVLDVEVPMPRPRPGRVVVEVLDGDGKAVGPLDAATVPPLPVRQP